MTIDFARLQESLGAALAANRPGSPVDHVIVVLPSFSVGESLLAHYAPRIPALEHRYLVSILMLARVPSCELVFLTCQDPGRDLVEYYISLLPAPVRDDVMRRFRLVVVPDLSGRAVAAKLLDRPDILAELRGSLRGRLAVIEPWNVTEHEVAVALALGAPINGTPPKLWPLGFKSAGRRLFGAAGVPVPVGSEDARSVDEVLAGIARIRQACPTAQGVVIKHDDSGAGDGNAVIGLRAPHGDATELTLRQRIEALPEWYLRDLQHGCVVEELVAGTEFGSPSVQVDISPSGEVTVIATHDQVLDPATGQVYTGCRFPATRSYAAEIGRYGQAVGEQLAARGAAGRLSVDFAVARDERDSWRVCALEINLRKGGTTHPFSVLRSLAPGRYDRDAGVWRADDGEARAYHATDNLIDPAWLGLSPADVIGAMDKAGLRYDHRTGTGVVLHMLACLAIDGRFGLTAIGRTAAQADELMTATRAAVHALVRPSVPA